MTWDVDQVVEQALQGEFSGYCCYSAEIVPKGYTIRLYLRKASENLRHSFDNKTATIG